MPFICLKLESTILYDKDTFHMKHGISIGDGLRLSTGPRKFLKKVSQFFKNNGLSLKKTAQSLPS